MEICCMAQETQTGALYQPTWEGVLKGRGFMYTYGLFMLRFDRKVQNSVKQLSFSKIKKLKNKSILYTHILKETRPSPRSAEFGYL